LIIALDASGSLRESGFEVLRNFAVNLTGTYRSSYASTERVRVGVILFGNGVLASDGTTSSATNLIGLTSDLAKVKAALTAAKWQRGYTNMAQAFTLADTMLQQGGRASAQSAVLVLSDGKYSFAFETEQAVNKLKAKGTMVYMAPVADRRGSWQHKLKLWASQPWQTNYQYLPGLQALNSSMGQYSATLIAKFCPKAISPKLQAMRNDQRGYIKIREKMYPLCLQKGIRGLGWRRGGLRRCARLVRRYTKFNGMMVLRPRWKRHGKRYCMAVAAEITPELWGKLLLDPSEYKCSKRSIPIPQWDIYALKPVA